MNYIKKEDHESKKPQQIIEDSQIIRFGARLKEAMNGMSNNAFAKKCGWSEKVIRNYVNGETYPDVDRLATISNMTGRSVEWLVTGFESSSNKTKVENKPLENTITPELQKAWLEILHRMTKQEVQQAINNINRNGLKILLDSNN